MITQKIDDAIAEYEATGSHPGEICLVMTREAFRSLNIELRAYIPGRSLRDSDYTFDRLIDAYRHGFATAAKNGKTLCLYNGIEIRPAEFGEGWAIVRKK